MSGAAAPRDGDAQRGGEDREASRARARAELADALRRETAAIQRDVQAIVSRSGALLADWSDVEWERLRSSPGEAVRAGLLKVGGPPVALEIPAALPTRGVRHLAVVRSDSRRRQAIDLLNAVTLRLLAASPSRDIDVLLIDPRGGHASCDPLVPPHIDPIASALTYGPVRDPGIGEAIERALASDRPSIVVVYDYPFGMSAHSVEILRDAAHGPDSRVTVLLAADETDDGGSPEAALYLDSPLFHVALLDPTRTRWDDVDGVFVPDAPPVGSRVYAIALAIEQRWRESEE